MCMCVGRGGGHMPLPPTCSYDLAVSFECKLDKSKSYGIFMFFDFSLR